MTLADAAARMVTGRRRTVLVTAALLALGAIVVLATQVHFASDVLDLLPQHFPSVQAFKTYDREFSQARELTFALLDEEHPADLDSFVEYFADQLRAEPWVIRVMERSPLDAAGGAQEAQLLALPLLLNLPPPAFQAAMHQLAPAEIDNRLRKLRTELEAGSPKAEAELDFDPLGLIAATLRPLSGAASMTETRPLASPDGSLRVVLAVTRQADLGVPACRATMQQVEDFKRRVLAGFDGPKPKILVTGRTPYVGELSLVMRADILSTIASSALLVTLVFWLGFRSLRPLLAILLVLLLCCVVAVAAGALIFHELNMITIGLCSILIGLGVDFGMLLFGIYQAERESGRSHAEAVAGALRLQGKGIFFGSITSAAAFLCLVFSGTRGFAQLGVLIAVGILFAGLFMTTVFLALLGDWPQPPGQDRLRRWGDHFVGRTLTSHRKLCVTFGLLLVALTLFAVAPIGRLRFDADPKTLEPRDSQAGMAMRTILRKIPSLGEPLLVLGQSPDAESFHENWTRLQAAWDRLVQSGALKSAASPGPLALSPATTKQNAATLSAEQVAGAKRALSAAIEGTGLQPSAFTGTFHLLDGLDEARQGHGPELDWLRVLPETSSWWFVIARFFGHSPGVGAAYVSPAQRLTSLAEAEALRTALTTPGASFQLSGWTYTLQHLVPWSQGKMLQLSLGMLGLNVILLLVLFRRAFPLAILLGGLLLSVGATLATLKLCGAALNLFNVLAFPLVLGVGVDYGIYVLLAFNQPGQRRQLSNVFKPVLLSGLTTVAGFASLITAQNPALRGLGIVCACGVGWCLASTFLFVLPACAWRGAR